MPAFDPAQSITITLPNGNVTVWDLDKGEGAGHGTAREVYSRNWQENKAVWRIACAWGDRQKIAIGMLGDSLGGVYTLPLAYWAVPAWVCSKIECTGAGIATPDVTTGFITFPYAILDITFGVPQYGNASMVSEMQLDFSANVVPVDQTTTSFKWPGGINMPPNSMPCIRNTSVFGSIKLFNRGTLNVLQYISLMNNVNSIDFQGASPKVVMFMGARSERIFTAAGQLQYNLTLLFEMNPKGWNVAYKPGAGWTAFTDLSGNDLYTASDLNALLV